MLARRDPDQCTGSLGAVTARAEELRVPVATLGSTEE